MKIGLLEMKTRTETSRTHRNENANNNKTYHIYLHKQISKEYLVAIMSPDNN